MAAYPMSMIEPYDLISFDYTNHKGIKARRRVTFHYLRYGSHPDYYPTPRILLHCYDNDKEDYRDFDPNKIENLTLT